MSVAGVWCLWTGSAHNRAALPGASGGGDVPPGDPDPPPAGLIPARAVFYALFPSSCPSSGGAPGGWGLGAGAGGIKGERGGEIR